MCLIKGAFVDENKSDVIKMHGTTIKKEQIKSVINELRRYPMFSSTVIFVIKSQYR